MNHDQPLQFLSLPPDGTPPLIECVPLFRFPNLLTKMNIGVLIGAGGGQLPAFILANWPGKLWLVGEWAALDTVALFMGRVDIIRGCSECAVPFFDDGCLDFVCTDNAALMGDLWGWLAKLQLS